MGGKSVSFLQDFKAFAMKGNVVDMAVGVIIGGAFGKIVTSLVNDVVMPLIGLAVGGVDFKDLKLMLSDEVLNEAGEVVKAATYMSYGNFLQVTFDFLIIALSIFTVIRLIGKLNRKEEAKAAEPAPEPAPAPEPEPTKEELLLAEIRDLLKAKK
ncbi:MAG: large-conductance mechanosensitive channel protein MscL [Paludibacteraceae bacterium]|nr:large-conductance mechanosensitive channel protein MscL [Paludibacteraceae bacterium]